VLVAYLAIYLSPLALRELRNRVTEVRTDILTHIAQPGRFTSIGGGLTFHIAGRQADGVLLGIFIDDRRDPKEHTTILAQSGEVVKNATGAFLLLDGGSVQTVEAGQTDPRIVTFQRYAFDLSNIGGSARTIVYSAHEKFFWELLSPADAQQQSDYRAELHDRLASPLYPIAFAILAYMFLGPPQTTRQSRALALVGMISAITVVRLAGFLSVIVGVHMPLALGIQYVVLAVAIAVGLWRISRGTAVEPAPAMAKLATVMTKWWPAMAS
jgi:lipopolysaccharide export system permease protein